MRSPAGSDGRDVPTTLLTGLPRSGTTLVCALLNRLPDTVALSEPRILALHGDRERALWEIDAFLAMTREAALITGRVPSQAIGGRAPENVAEPPRDDGRLRRVRAVDRLIEVGKPLSSDFHLVVKHPALFTALAEPLRRRRRLVAIVRHPLAVLASWQTVDMPPNRGRLPRAEAFAPDLAARLAAAPDVLTRQIALLGWMLGIYATFPPSEVLRYEDLIAGPGAALAILSPNAATLPARLDDFDIAQRYAGVDLAPLAAALLDIRDLAEPFYPDFARSLERWRGSDT
jgi:hypothetical protein